ncbi:MAG: N-6 DNA methylase [Gammaproteobacteria bacterium]|nr:N-6 DNA methylase [Gammaproteobacteria bacterium]MDE0246439.1 N-6 DNA methylase [Gammaproteobacteria bacterium]
MSDIRTTNELEFQGTVLSWLNHELTRRHFGLELATQEPSKDDRFGLELATQEPTKGDRRRNDLVVWRNRGGGVAFLTIELKTPTTPITDIALLRDACHKAQRWQAPFFAVWNMQAAELYRTPSDNKPATPIDLVQQFPPIDCVKSVSDWIDADCRMRLRQQALDLLDASYMLSFREGIELHIDASVFVDRLATRITELRAETVPALRQVAHRHKNVRRRLREISATQGFLDIVDDIPSAIAGQYCYRLVGQILFYCALRRKQPSLAVLDVAIDKPFREAVRPYWNRVRHFDYEALFEPHELDAIVPLTDHADKLLRGLVLDFLRYDWNTLSDDVLGSIFEQLIPRQEQILLGQFYTPTPVADLLILLALDGESPSVLDPGCGSGTFLLRTYQYLSESRGLDHGNLLSSIWGFDISPFAAELAVINLFRQDLSEFNNFPRVLCADFFERVVGERVQFPPARGGTQSAVALTIPEFDAVVGNPPYLRSQHQDDLDPEYKAALFGVVLREHGIAVPSKSDLFAFFVYHAHRFLKVGGRLAFVTSSSWLTADYGYRLQRFLLEEFNLIAIIGSDAESFFTQVEQNTVLFVAEKRKPDTRPLPNDLIRFVTLKEPLRDINRAGPQYWSNVGALIDRIETTADNYEDSSVRIKCVDASMELASLQSRAVSRNWSVYIRGSSEYWQMVEADSNAFVPLSTLASVHLGYKSLQNQFYYLTKETIRAYGIEDRYLHPILKLENIDTTRFLQTGMTATSVFVCTDSVADIRGTGAHRYIEAMRGRPAAAKTQATGGRTIEDALEKQSGSVWYAPKAVLHASHIWLRKAFDGTYAPFVFEDARVLDQRCNFLRPTDGVEWTELAALLTSSVFALSVEAEGSASLGGGALEMATTKLARIRVPDIRRFPPKKRQRLVLLARSVWEHDEPVNWTDTNLDISEELDQLDQFILDECGGVLSAQQLHTAIRTAVEARRRIARDKSKARKAAVKADVTTVAEGIVKGIRTQADAVQFPESFLPLGCVTRLVELDSRQPYSLLYQPFLGTVTVRVISAGDHLEFEHTVAEAIGELIVRALMLGRRNFEFPEDESVAVVALHKFVGWIRPILDEIEDACASSFLGSRLDNRVLQTTYSKLGWSEHVGATVLPEQVLLQASVT